MQFKVDHSPISGLIKAIVQGMQAKKAQDIRLVDLTKIPNTAVDHFVICSADTHRQVEAIANAITEASYKQVGERPWKQEGMLAKEWILLDYVNIVAHVFQTERRSFYALETIWADAAIACIES